MQVQIQRIHFDGDADLIKETTEKLNKLEKLYDRIESCHATLKKEKNSYHKKFFAEVRLAVPKEDLVASERAESFGQAIEQVTDDLKKQLVKHKEKMNAFDRVKPEEEGR